MDFCKNCGELIDTIYSTCPFCLVNPGFYTTYLQSSSSTSKSLPSLATKISTKNYKSSTTIHNNNNGEYSHHIPTTSRSLTHSNNHSSSSSSSSSSTTFSPSNNNSNRPSLSYYSTVRNIIDSQNSMDNTILSYESPPPSSLSRKKKPSFKSSNDSPPINNNFVDLSQNDEEENNFIVPSSPKVKVHTHKRQYNQVDEETDTTEENFPHSLPPRPLPTTTTNKNARKLQKEIKGQQKLQEKEIQLQTKFENVRERGGYARQEIALLYSAEFATHPILSLISTSLTNEKAGNLFPQNPLYDTNIPYSFQWRRGRMMYPQNNNTSSTSRSNPIITSDNVDFSPSVSTIEPYMCLIYDGARYIQLVQEKKYEGIVKLFEEYKSLCIPNTQISVIIINLEKAMSEYLRAKTDRFHIRDSMSHYTITTLNTHIWVATKVHFIMQDTYEKTADYLARSTRFIADKPYKTEETSLACVMKKRVSTANANYKDEKGDKTAEGVWGSMLQMIPGISETIAVAITSKYPSLALLMEQYQNPNLSLQQKKLLLETLPGFNRKFSTISQKIYQFLMSNNPEEMIGE